MPIRQMKHNVQLRGEMPRSTDTVPTIASHSHHYLSQGTFLLLCFPCPTIPTTHGWNSHASPAFLHTQGPFCNPEGAFQIYSSTRVFLSAMRKARTLSRRDSTEPSRRVCAQPKPAIIELEKINEKEQ